MSLAFHACPPAGQWMNDPNALLQNENGYLLLAQYRSDGPAFVQTHWARWTSPDLLDWQFDGVAIAGGDDDAYSGCVVDSIDGLRCFYTANERSTGLQRQVTRTSPDGGWSWLPPMPVAGPAQTNRRDPFVWQRPDGAWRMLIARPGDWERADERGVLEMWHSADGAAWREIGRIGPFSACGMLWEVPVLIEYGASRAMLIVSVVDRTRGGADSSVHYWAGAFDGLRFAPDDDGHRLDLGPDFYAATIGQKIGTEGDAVAVAWLSNWQTARTMAWPGFAGGAISLPRTLRIEGHALCQSPPAAIRDAFTVSTTSVPRAGMTATEVRGEWRLSVQSSDAHLTISSTKHRFEVRREGEAAIRWSADHPPLTKYQTSGHHHLALYLDGPLVELFIDDRTAVSAAVPGATASFAISLSDDTGEIDLPWHVLPRHAVGRQ